ncbi:quinoprotein dehydrogenase-associated SoxYZ-like carrier [Halomonas sp. BLK-85]
MMLSWNLIMYPSIHKSVRAASIISLAVLFSLVSSKAFALPEDIHKSPMWQYNIERYLGTDADVVHTDKVSLKVPDFAEDSAQVPLTIALDRFEGDIRSIVSWVDLNPVPHLFSYQPHQQAPLTLALNFRVQQATTVRAAIQDENDVWHIASAHVDAAGGGCTAPSVTASNPHWSDQLGNSQGRYFSRPASNRLKLSIMHPMDSGMVENVPIFHINEIQIHAVNNDKTMDEESLLGEMSLSESASENPLFVFDFAGDDSNQYALRLRDTQGNVFKRILGDT